MWRFALLVLIASACSFNPGVSGGDAQAGDDSRTDDAQPPTVFVRPITINAGKVNTGPHADFPLLVAMTADWLRATANGGDVQSAQGFDIRFFADPARTTPLAFEVERYRPDIGELIAWVKVPSLSTTTVLYVAYGDPAVTTSQATPAAVWSAGYAAVWHLGDFADSTGVNNSTDSNTVAATGKIGDARGFNGSNSELRVTTNASITGVFATGGTAEAWFFANNWGENNFGRIADKASFAFGACTSTVPNSLLFGRAFTQGSGNWCTDQNSAVLATWTHVVVVYDESSAANDPSIFINGIEKNVTSTTTPNGVATTDTGNLTIGDRTSGGQRAFGGLIDELRLSKVERSPGWIATTYANQSDPAGFYTIGAP